MSKRIHFLALFMVAALLLCEVNLTITDPSYRLVSDTFTKRSAMQTGSVSRVTGHTFIEFCTSESVSGHAYGSLFSIRSQTKGRESQRSGIRTLLLFVSILCLLRIAFLHLRCRLFLPQDAIASSAILLFIHSKDGKK